MWLATSTIQTSDTIDKNKLIGTRHRQTSVTVSDRPTVAARVAPEPLRR
jgi:hypothetical protein